MKHFSSLVLLHLVFISRKLRLSWSTEDAIAFALHTALSHLEKQGSYVRMLFVDFNSPFNTIILDILIPKLANLRLPPSTCSWIRDLLVNRPQRVKLGPYYSSSHALSTSSPQGCVLSPLIYSLYTSDCSPAHPENIIVKLPMTQQWWGWLQGEN